MAKKSATKKFPVVADSGDGDPPQFIAPPGHSEPPTSKDGTWYADIFTGAIRRLSPRDALAVLSLSNDTLPKLVAAVADETQALTQAQLEIQAQQQRRKEIASLDRSADEMVDEVLASALDCNAQLGLPPVEWPPDYRGELLTQLRQGLPLELEDLRVAAFTGNLKCFIESKHQPDFATALESVHRARLKRSRSASKGPDFEQAKRAFRLAKFGVPLGTSYQEMFQDEHSASASVESYLRGLFFHDMPQTLLRYWLPLALWTLSTKAALTRLRDLPMSLLASNTSAPVQLASQLSAKLHVDAKKLLSAVTKSQSKNFTSVSFEKEVSTHKLHRSRRRKAQL